MWVASQADQASAARYGAPDALSTLRQFVGSFGAALNDQSYAGQDYAPFNPTGQFATRGPYSTAIEGQPVAITSTAPGGLVLSPTLLLVLAAAGAGWMLSRR